MESLTPEEMQAAAAALAYEVKSVGQHFAWTRWYAVSGPAVLRNACLEATLVHLRLVIEFVAGRPSKNPSTRNRHSSDVMPQHFVAAWQDQSGVKLDGYLDRLDKHVVHLTTERAKTTGVSFWPLERMIDDLLFEFRSFADAARLDGSPYAELFTTALAEADQAKAHE